MAENTRSSSFLKPQYYHHHNVIGMAVALHRYESINSQYSEISGLAVRYGPPVVNGIIQTEDVHILAATGIYIPSAYFYPRDKLPALELEYALTQLYKARGIERKDGIEREISGVKKEKTSAERTCQ